jgi:hypothetical protein
MGLGSTLHDWAKSRGETKLSWVPLVSAAAHGQTSEVCILL